MESCAVDGIFIALIMLPLLFSRWRPRLRLLGSNVPSVDVIIPYAARPPSVPERERLMGMQGKNGVRYAKEDAKKGSWSL
ncbi:hypothetical protein B0T16DRAFT_462347 [Cercophora newfieldiana]|uniref:Uncharacterized protein n=1 Tax=Cercophora newfieldiana TaxID=92897 RepID=A0AA39XQY2_9PEZI|nr:hypothetical protein B0T16DRAFT_462347 [Cercophora newfieldiana]